METESSINNEISKIAELIKEDDVKFDDNIFNDNMAECVRDIVKEIEEKVNADSISSVQKDHIESSENQLKSKNKNKNKKGKHKAQNSLAYKMRSRLLKYQKHMNFYQNKKSSSNKRSKSGNNPCYSYPSIPPPVQFDPKYSRNNSENYTKFVGQTVYDGKEVNLLDTVDRLYQFQKSTLEKMDAQRYLKYHDEIREVRAYPRVKKSISKSKSENSLPLYMRSDLLAKSHDKRLRDMQKEKLNQLEQELLEDIERHEMLAVHTKNSRQKFTVEEWEIYYNKRFKKFLTKRAEDMEKKTEKMYQQIMVNPHSKHKLSNEEKVEDRLLNKGKAYQDKLAQIRKHSNEPQQIKCISKNSMKILENKYIKEHGKNVKPTSSDIESAATRIDSKAYTQSPFSVYKSGVASDFLSIPMTSPRQHINVEGKMSVCDEDVCAYRNKIKLMESPLQYNESHHQNLIRKSKSRNKERMEQLMKRTGKTAGTTSDSKNHYTGKSSNSGVNSFQGNRSNKEISSDENIYNDDSENQKLGETETIEKMINGDYDNDHHFQYYSIGNKDSFGVIEGNRIEHDLYERHEHQDLIIDPFYRRQDEQHQEYNEEDFETARLNTEGLNQEDNSYENKKDQGKDLTHNKSSSSEFKEDGSFDNIEQMKEFLHSIKKGVDLVSKQMHNGLENEANKNEVKDSISNAKEESKEDDESGEPQTVEFVDNEADTLEMIQEETENDTTKQKDSLSPDRLRSPSEPLIKAKGLIEGSDEQSIKNFKNTEDIDDENKMSEKDKERRKEELMNKVISSAYTSRNSLKANLMESLDVNKNEIKELEELGVDALTIIKRIMSEYPQLFGESLKNKTKRKGKNKTSQNK